jgi:predicted dehydrogenase
MELSSLKVKAENGEYGLAHAYWYSGEEGNTPAGQMSFSPVNQQVLQMDDFADCVMRNKNTIVPGEMGLEDIRIVEAIYRSIASGKRERI